MALVNHINNLIKESRFNFVYGFIGYNRSGKSSIARKIIEWWRSSRPDKKVIGHDPQKKFKGLIDIHIRTGNETWAQYIVDNNEKFRGCLIVLDDYRLVQKKPIPIKGLEDLMYFRAEWNIDIIYICHNPSLIINLLTYFTSHYFIFKIKSTDGSFERKIPHYDLCIAACNKINSYVKNFTDQQYKDLYPKFPYVIVDTDKEQLFGINLK